MAKTAIPTSAVVVTGDGLTLNQAVSGSTNVAAPPPGTVTLSNGFTAITVPSGFTINGVMIVPPSGSTVTKTLKGITGDTGVGPSTWTSGVAMLPVSSSSVFGIAANAAEVCQLVWY
jgi:hypothetical protein